MGFQCGTYFMSLFWRLEFCGGCYIFGKLVHPCSNCWFLVLQENRKCQLYKVRFFFLTNAFSANFCSSVMLCYCTYAYCLRFNVHQIEDTAPMEYRPNDCPMCVNWYKTYFCVFLPLKNNCSHTCMYYLVQH